ncbi:hypothetical protein HFU84_07000 [Acidithiobacillus sp. CV18-2]|nr:hypothetical protein [Acidithiobacillus sp. CV18-3]MBU2755998.1 hypothetical protein [Acidithiobacillus sp. BN09-2]MBU2777253.1 hypothetical protein [Acidithiobacillus sp. CV18-2]MBU2799897.1 hypothetical protein [Acidithiobacillus sp. VAN18-4]
MKHGQAIEEWARETMAKTDREAKRERLRRLLAGLHRHPDSASLPVGSPQRILIQSHERNLMQEAVNLGYEPPEQILKEMGLHLALELGVGL